MMKTKDCPDGEVLEKRGNNSSTQSFGKSKKSYAYL
jgi:hypothetical protein